MASAAPLTTVEQLRAAEEKAAAAIDIELTKRIDELRKEYRTRKAPLFEKRTGVVAAIPMFWLQCLKRCKPLMTSYCAIQGTDEAALAHLVDVRCVDESATGFTIDFTFSENQFFTESVLTKKYVFEASSSGDASFYLDHTVATKISWQSGRDLTKKTVQVKAVNRRTGQVSMVDKEVFVPSFFTFFNQIVPLPDVIAEDEEGDLAARQEALQTDFDVGEIFKDDIVPHATKFFQGRDLSPADLAAPEGSKL